MFQTIFGREKIHTQIQLLRKVAITVIIFVLAVAVLMTFEKVRYLGTSLLASAGIAGIIVGFAAQKSIATLLAGIQVAITQPVRIDDVVIMENEWGRIEEITLTYLVVKIWDERRLIFADYLCSGQTLPKLDPGLRRTPGNGIYLCRLYRLCRRNSGPPVPCR